MSTPDPRLRLEQHLDTLYRTTARQFPCDTADRESFLAWQADARSRVRDLLGIGNLPELQVVNQVLQQSRDCGAYTEEKWAITTDEEVVIPLYFLIPHSPGPFPALLVFHGHNPSVQYILGHYPDEETARRQRVLDDNYAQRLAELGYLVCAVEQRSFGERLSHFDDRTPHPNSCRHQAFFYQMMGRTVVGERCRDGMVGLELLRQRTDVLPERIGVTGCSGGGTVTLWLGAIEPGLQVVVPGNYFCSFRASIMDLRHCECNYVPGAARLFEMGDIAALTAPRPFLAIQGIFDDIFPVEAARQEFVTVARAYACLDVPERCAMVERPTGHAYSVQAAQAFFTQWL